MIEWDNIEDAFKELDSNQFRPKAHALGSYMNALLAEGFTREEAMGLVQAFSKFTYDMAIEEFISKKDLEWERILEENDSDDDVDSTDESL